MHELKKTIYTIQNSSYLLKKCTRKRRNDFVWFAVVSTQFRVTTQFDKKIEIKILLICNAYLMNIYWFRLIAIFQINICVITFSFKCLNLFRVDARVRSAITKGTLFYASYRDRQTDSSIKKNNTKTKAQPTNNV